MAIIKSYTNIEQSRKLVEILPVESADMYYHYITSVNSYYEDVPKYVQVLNHFVHFHHDIPCWSLAALLGILANLNCIWLGTDDVSAWRCVFNLGKGEHLETTEEYINPIDACYKLIIELHEKNLI